MHAQIAVEHLLIPGDRCRHIERDRLAVMQHELGSLDNVRRVVKTLGMVNCAPGFNRTPQVIDGCSALLIEVGTEEPGW